MSGLVPLILAAAVATSVHAAEPSQYLRITDIAAGLHYDRHKNQWRGQAFIVGTKYILRHLNDAERDHERMFDPTLKATWGFFRFGDSTLTAACTDSSVFSCKPRVADVLFGKGSRRFEVTHVGDYVAQGYLKYLQQTNPER